MFRKIIIAVFLCAVFGSSSSLTLFPNTKQVFPSQFPSTENEQSFFRIDRDNQIESLTCPDGFTFDIKALKCRHISKPKRFSNSASTGNGIACPGHFRGTLANSLNCRTYLDCWDGIGYEMPCTAHLLYSTKVKQCEWPERANCCEFWEHDPEKLVADM